MPNLPSGTVTFLFTDIEGSTKLAREHPDSWESARAHHHAILRRAIEANNGFVFEIIGDAFCAAFHRPWDALKAAIESQQDLLRESWEEVAIRVRMGIHTGEAETDGSKYRGYLTMSLVQRLMSSGHGGQILLSGATENLLRDQLRNEIHLLDLGKYKFKDIPQAVRVFQAAAPDLSSGFPPLRTFEIHPNNLPTDLTSFVGREKELEDVKRLLHDTHILTLLGPGGAGKTRLSLKVASELLEQYPDGVWFVELAPILDPTLVPRTTAVTVGLREDPQRPVLEMLCDFLRDKKLLLLLDNCEHLVDACAQMTDKVLHVAPSVRILTSSREALGIAGEVTYRVPSLGLPDMEHLPPVESLSQYEAVKLFIDRATSAVPAFAVTKDNAPALAQICHQLDGIPLALELAAAKVRVLSLDQIARRLDDRFRLLTGGSRTALERHQTLRAAIDWSYNLLPSNEQLLFGRLSVFVGGWTLEAAESVCAGGSNASKTSPEDGIQVEDVLDLMEQLIVKSLVITEELQSEQRFHMLETIRQYASEKLMESDVFQGNHAIYFLNLAEAVEPSLETSEQAKWLDKLERELNNFRAALRRAVERGQAELGLRLASALCLFWFVRGHLSEGLEQIEKFLSLPDQITNETTCARALDRAGMLARYQGNLPRAYELILKSLSLRRELGDPRLVADSISNLGFVVLHQGDFAKARELYSESLSINREIGNQQGIADSLSHLALMAFYDGDYRSALVMDEASLAIWRGLGDQQGIAWALHRLGNVKLHQNEYSAARQLFIESLDISNKVGFKWGIANSAEGLAAVAAETGQAASAILLAGGASALRKAIGIPLSDMALAEFESLLASARKLLDREDAEAIWSKGLALDIEQIVRQAKEVL